MLGDFELRREVGRGGMGRVYEAWQISLQRTVALKVLSPHIASTGKAVSRFRREAQAAAKLHHTHIVPIFAQGESNGTYFYAMEYVEGESLHARIMDLRSRHRREAPAIDQSETVVLDRSGDSETRRTQTAAVVVPASDAAPRVEDVDSPASTSGLPFGGAELFHEAARHLADVADALEYAHLQGVVHRDIKPHNLLFGQDGRLRISDFGLARLAAQPGVTMTGEMLGSPLYMSPEQITGDPNLVDHRTDVYSLGATMYEWLTLAPPYPGETREQVIGKILSSEPRPLRAENPAVPIDLETICLKAIERDRDRRYRSAGEMRDDLRRFVLSRPIVARRAGAGTRIRRFISRHQLATLGSAAVLVASGLLWALFTKERSVRHQKEVTQKAEAAVEQATQKFQETEKEKELLVQALGMFANAVVPGGGAVVERVASAGVPTPGMPVNALDMSKFRLTIGMPAGIALRAVEEFYRSAVSPDWPDGAQGGLNPLATNIHSAFERWAAGDLDNAAGLVTDYLNAMPSDTEAIQMHAALSALLGQFGPMREDADRLLSSGGRNNNGYLWRGLAFLLDEKVDPSLADLTRATALDKQSLWAKVFRGLALVQADRTEDAIKLFDEVLKESPSLTAAHLGRARAHTAEGDFAAAVPDLDEVLKVDPKNAHALTIRGECRAVMEDYEAAKKDLREAMDVVGEVPELVYRWTKVTIAMQQRGSVEKKEAGTEMEAPAHRGTVDPDEGSSRPPLFDWLSPKRKMPQSNRESLDQSRGAGESVRIAWPLRLPT